MLIAVAAHAIRVRHTLGVENVADFVRLVTVHAGGQDVRLFLPKLTSDRLAMHLFHLRVALGAGRRDVAPVNRGVRIGMRQDVVRRVARHAVGGHHQALLEQGLAVDAFRIVLQNVVLVDLPVGLHRRTLAVAPAADERHFQGGDG